MGKPDAAFVVTGTMAQLCTLLTHREAAGGGPDQPRVMMVHPTSHLLNHEVSGKPPRPSTVLTSLQHAICHVMN